MSRDFGQQSGSRDSGVRSSRRVADGSGFRQLREMLVESPDHGLYFSAPENRPEALRLISSPLAPPGLKDYFADGNTKAIIRNNMLWASGRAARPLFQFAYLMLPTPCNQRCPGCFMGQDKRKLPPHLDGDYFTPQELDEILYFLVEHGARAAVYGGGGELFAWKGAFSFLERISKFGLTPVLFTNATLLKKEDTQRLADLGAAVIISLRDTVEDNHDELVRRESFRSSITVLEQLLELGLHHDRRLAVEIPVTRNNSERVLNDLLPALRYLGVVALIEEYIQITTSDAERSRCHSFAESRAFFKRAHAVDEALGYSWTPETGTRMIGQPKCRRSLYSFALFPSRDVLDCPSHSICLGNLKEQSIHEIMYSDRYQEHLRHFSLCPCSVFYTTDEEDIPTNLPGYLEELR